MKTISHRAWSTRTALALLGLAIATSCGRDGVAPTAPGSANLDRHSDRGSIQAPTLKLSDESVRFEDVEGEADVSPVYVKVTEKDGVVLTGLTATATSSVAGWLNATLDATTTPTKVLISVTTDNLLPDDYKGSVVVTAPGADKSPDEIKVTLSIDKAHRKLVVATAPGGAVAGVAFTTQPVIQILMVPSNKLSKDNDKVTAQIVGFPGLLGGTTTVKAHNGVATFTDLSVPTAATYTLLFTADGDASVSATLVVTSPQVQTYVISLSANPSNAGTAIGGGTVNAGNVTVTASPNSGYTFSNWTENGVVVSPSATYQFTANSDRTLVANFVPAVYTLTVNVVSNGAFGTLTSTPDGISCDVNGDVSPGKCTAQFLAGPVILAYSSDHWVSAVWTVDGGAPITTVFDPNIGIVTLTINMTASTHVTVTLQ